MRNIFLCIFFVVGLTFPAVSDANDCLVTDWKISAKVQNKKPLDVRNTFTVEDRRVYACTNKLYQTGKECRVLLLQKQSGICVCKLL